MARIRSIKPEICTSDQFVECSTTARLLFILLWLHCDDAGRHPASVKRLKMECFPGDSFSEVEMQGLMRELISADLIVEYEHENERYWAVKTWEKHQRIDRPTYRYGPLDRSGKPVQIGGARRGLDEGSTSDRPRIGVESSGEERSLSAAAKAAAAELSSIDGEEVTRQANRLRRACPSLLPDFVWQTAWIAELVSRGMVADLAEKVSVGQVAKPRSYIEAALRAECRERGFDWRELLPVLPPLPPEKTVLKPTVRIQ